MVEIKFSGTTTENLIRQVQAFAERVEIRDAKKAGKHERIEQPKPVFFTEEEQERMVGYKKR